MNPIDQFVFLLAPYPNGYRYAVRLLMRNRIQCGFFVQLHWCHLPEDITQEMFYAEVIDRNLLRFGVQGMEEGHQIHSDSMQIALKTVHSRVVLSLG